jgi:hypothetical protein
MLPQRATCRTVAILAILAASGMSQVSAQDTNSKAVPALRLAIQYSDGGFTLLSQRSLRKALPPSDPLPQVDSETPTAPGNWSGFWYELVAADGSVLYRQIGENPILRVFEGPDPDDPSNRAVRHEAVPAQRVFSILVPDLAVDSRPGFVVFFSSPLRPGAQAEPAAEIGRVQVYGDPGPAIAAVQGGEP